jgi:hypothetical protein
MFPTVIKLTLIIKCFLIVISKLSETVSLSEFMISNVYLSIFFHRLALTVHESIHKISTIDVGIFTSKLNITVAMFLVGKKVTLIEVFILSNLNAIALPCNLLVRTVSDVFTNVDCVIEVTNHDDIFVVF